MSREWLPSRLMLAKSRIRPMAYSCAAHIRSRYMNGLGHIGTCNMSPGHSRVLHTTPICTANIGTGDAAHSGAVRVRNYGTYDKPRSRIHSHSRQDRCHSNAGERVATVVLHNTNSGRGDDVPHASGYPQYRRPMNDLRHIGACNIPPGHPRCYTILKS